MIGWNLQEWIKCYSNWAERAGPFWPQGTTTTIHRATELHRYCHYFILNHLDDVSLIISKKPFAQHNLSRPSARPSPSVPDRSHSTVILQTQNRNTANHTFKHHYFTIKSVHSYYNTELYLFIRKKLLLPHLCLAIAILRCRLRVTMNLAVIRCGSKRATFALQRGVPSKHNSQQNNGISTSLSVERWRGLGRNRDWEVTTYPCAGLLYWAKFIRIMAK